MIAKKLRQGDEIRVIAPSCSLGLISEENTAAARARLERLGFKVSFGKNVGIMDSFQSSPVESRLADLHAAFSDPGIAAILTVIGGFNCNQILKGIDYGLIGRNPRIFCGYSDITALQNAILTQTGLVTYSGPHFSTFAMQQGLEYTIDQFWKCLVGKAAFEVPVSDRWSDDPWYRDQENRQFEPNRGPVILQPGVVEGKIIGGNLCTLNLLQGTEFMPPLKDSILFLEEDALIGESSASEFDRNLQSLLHLPSADGIRGVVIGRFQRGSKMSPDRLREIIKSKSELSGRPIIADVDFGHTSPMITFPIGGKCRIEADGPVPRITILTH